MTNVQVKNDDQALFALLKKGKLVKVEGFFKSETYQKDGRTLYLRGNHILILNIQRIQNRMIKQKVRKHEGM